MEIPSANNHGAHNNAQGNVREDAQHTDSATRDGRSARSATDLDTCYRRIGIPAVAAALASRGPRNR